MIYLLLAIAEWRGPGRWWQWLFRGRIEPRGQGRGRRALSRGTIDIFAAALRGFFGGHVIGKFLGQGVVITLGIAIAQGPGCAADVCSVVIVVIVGVVVGVGVRQTVGSWRLLLLRRWQRRGRCGIVTTAIRGTKYDGYLRESRLLLLLLFQPLFRVLDLQRFLPLDLWLDL